MNITAAIYAHARLRPHAPAIISPAGSLNYGQLDAAIWRAAVNFKAQGLEPGQVVMLDIGDSVRHLIVALALGRIGVAHLSKFPQQDVSAMAPLMARVKTVRTIATTQVPDDVLFSQSESRSDGVEAIARDMAKYTSQPWYYVTSSGTTGQPRIVPITHAVTVQRSRLLAAGEPTLVSDRFVPCSPLAFHVSKGRCAHTLIIGGCVVFVDGLSLEAVLDAVSRMRVTRISCAVVHLHQLCTVANARALAQHVRVLDVVGSDVPEKLRRLVRENVSKNLYISYGATEAGVVTVAPPEADLPGTVGTLLPGVSLQIVDEADKPLPRGEVGLIRMRASGMVEGYHDDPEATAKAFRGGWFYPGDLGMLTEDEQLIFRGRADDMMIFDGINIYPAEIESVLAAHEAVVAAAAFALKSDVHQDVPVAAVSLSAPVTEADLLAFSRVRLGARAPQRIVAVEALPRNAAGKVLKRELADMVRRQLASEAAGRKSKESAR